VPVSADAVDSTNIGPVKSFLPPGANTAAQALIADPTLRSFSAEKLARILHISVSDARAGIGAIIGMINHVALGSPQSALMPNPSLAIAVGPFMSLDAAMSRFGSHMGPVVVSPQPRPGPYYQGDYPPDRQYGAGHVEAGDISTTVHDTAMALVSFYASSTCASSPGGVVSAFQRAFNRDFAPSLAVDDKYGPATQDALDHVIAAAPASSDLSQVKSPPPCYPGPGTYTAPVTTIYGTPSPSASPISVAPSSPTPATPTATPVARASMMDSPWTWVGIAALVAAASISQSKHPPKWARKIGLAQGHVK
jgi:hypothetical protein